MPVMIYSHPDQICLSFQISWGVLGVTLIITFVFDTNNHKFGVIQNILEVSYKSMVKHVLTFNLTSWYGHL